MTAGRARPPGAAHAHRRRPLPRAPPVLRGLVRPRPRAARPAPRHGGGRQGDDGRAIRDLNPVLFFEHMYLYHAVRGGPRGRPHHPHRPRLRAPGRAGGDGGGDGVDGAPGPGRGRAPGRRRDRGGGARPGLPGPPGRGDPDRLRAQDRAPGGGPRGLEDRGLGAEVAAVAAQECFYHLDAPVLRVGAPHAPVPISKPLRDLFLPDETDVLGAVRGVLAA